MGSFLRAERSTPVPAFRLEFGCSWSPDAKLFGGEIESRIDHAEWSKQESVGIFVERQTADDFDDARSRVDSGLTILPFRAGRELHTRFGVQLAGHRQGRVTVRILQLAHTRRVIEQLPNRHGHSVTGVILQLPHLRKIAIDRVVQR